MPKTTMPKTIGISDFLSAHEIKWYPIQVKYNTKILSDNTSKVTKSLVPYYKCIEHNIEFKVDYNDFKTITDKELKRRQKCVNCTDTIAIDTLEVQQIDVDDVNNTVSDVWKPWLKEYPYYLSATKNLPHIFCTGQISKVINKVGVIDYLCGQWAWCKTDAVVHNHKKGINAAPDYVLQEKKPGTKKPGTKKPVTKKLTKHDKVLFEDGAYEPTDIQIEALKSILNSLPPKYYDEYQLWRNICWAIRSYSNCKIVHDVFIEFSQKSSKFDLAGCIKLWNNTPERDEVLSMGTLIKYYKDANKDYDREPIRQLWYPKPFNLMEDVEELKITTETFDRNYVTDKKGEVKIFDIEDIKDKFIVVKSHTGSGKTCLLSKIRKHYQDQNIDTVSITSRRSLAKAHSQVLNMAYYEDETEDCKSIALQLDSIDRLDLAKYDKKVVVILDELDSLINHFQNNMTKMRTKRCEMINRLFDLINNKACVVIGVDADISTTTLRYLKQMVKLDIHLYWNKKQLDGKCDVNYDMDKEDMVKTIIRTINKNQPVFVCSDSYSQFDKEVYQRVIKKIHKTKLDRIRFYASVEGDKDDFRDPGDWHDKFVFCSPSILYGIDCNYEAEVFGFYYGNTMNALQCCQQIARIRKPVKINLCLPKPRKPLYYHWNDVKTFYEEIDSVLCKSFDANMIQKWGANMISYYKEFVYRSEFKDDQLTDLNFHIPDILSKKGHTMYRCGEKDKSNFSRSMSSSKYRELKSKQLDAILQSGDVKKKDFAKYEQCLKRCDILGINDMKVFIEEVDPFVKEVVTNDHMFRDYLTLKLMRHDTVYLQEKLRSHDDIYTGMLQSSEMKAIELKKLFAILKIDSMYDLDYIKALKDDDQEIQVNLDIPRKVWKLRGEMYKKTSFKRHELVKITLELCNSTFKSILEPKKKKIKGKQYYYKEFIQDRKEKYTRMIQSDIPLMEKY